MDYQRYAKEIHSILHDTAFRLDEGDSDNLLSRLYEADSKLYEEELRLCPFCGSEVEIIMVTSESSIVYEGGCREEFLKFYDIRCTYDDCFLRMGTQWQITNKNELIRKFNHNRIKER